MIIKSIVPVGIAAPLIGPIKMAKSQHTSAKSMLVRIEDTDGNTGWGEASEAPMMNGETVPGMIAAVLYLVPLLEGLEIPDPQIFVDIVTPMILGNHGAIAALDIAIYDLVGKRDRLPVYELLGGKKRDHVSALWMLAANEIEKDTLTARRKAQEGFSAFKIKAGINAISDDLDRCRAVRKVVGTFPRISADANMGLTFEDAIEFAQAAQSAGIDFIEQPIDSNDLSGMAHINAAAGPAGVCADEGIRSLSDITRHFETKAATGVGLKAIKLGGLTRMLEAANCANDLALHVNIAGKVAETAVASAAIIHLAVAAPQVDWDISVTCQYVARDVADNPPTAVDGKLHVQDAPGLGIRIDEQAIEGMII